MKTYVELFEERQTLIKLVEYAYSAMLMVGQRQMNNHKILPYAEELQHSLSDITGKDYHA